MAQAPGLRSEGLISSTWTTSRAWFLPDHTLAADDLELLTEHHLEEVVVGEAVHVALQVLDFRDYDFCQRPKWCEESCNNKKYFHNPKAFESFKLRRSDCNLYFRDPGLQVQMHFVASLQLNFCSKKTKIFSNQFLTFSECKLRSFPAFATNS